MLLVVTSVFLLLGHAWLAWELLRAGEGLAALLVALIPMPLVGLVAWYRTHWDVALRLPASCYFAGYLLAAILQVATT